MNLYPCCALHRLILLMGLVLGATNSPAAVELASPFTSHMVLQCDTRVPVWGWASPGEKVTVAFAGQAITTLTGADGRWRVELAPLAATAESRVLTVAGDQTPAAIQLADVVVGEVWLASGQSNMDFTVSKKVKYFAGVANEEAEIAAARYPLMRMFTGAFAKTYAPTNREGGQWLVCSPETVPGFSAVGYFFARDVQREIKIPVGIITEAFGASAAEAWLRRETLAADPQLKPLLDNFDAKVEAFRTNPPPVVAPPRSEDVSARETNGLAGGQNATNATPGRRRRAPASRDPVQDQHNATVLYNGMIAPIIPYALRGVIWYQGESIVGGGAGRALYPRVQATLVRDWRALWAQGDFPFYIVQLAGQAAESNNPLVREAQASILQLPNTGMAVTVDIGERTNVHPKNKQDVGDRLARIALARVYGRKVEYSGPQYTSMQILGHEIRLRFTHLGGGLVARGGPLKGFVIAGTDGQFVAAQAELDGDSIVVHSDTVAAPTAVRYAWANYPEGCNLYNAAGLPAPPFRTDAPVFVP